MREHQLVYLGMSAALGMVTLLLAVGIVPYVPVLGPTAVTFFALAMLP